MAELRNEKDSVDVERTAAAGHDGSTMPADFKDTGSRAQVTVFKLPKGRMYRSFELGPLKLPYYASPSSQLIVVGLVAFLTAGMFNALSGLGGGGQVDPIINDKANTALYSTFSVVGFFAGTFVNRLGIRSTLSFGGFGYAIFVASFLCYNHTANGGFVIFAGALLGCCAGLLWAAQGAIMMSYPQEKDKGKYISWFWMIFNLGAVIGSLIPLGENINNTGGTVTDGTYIGFMILNLIGAGLALCLVDANHIIRRDGSRVILMKHPTWQSEIFGLWEVIRSDPYIILLFPMFFSANFFYNYHFTAINLSRFTIRARSLNSLLYWTSQIIGAYVFGYTLDFPRVSRKARARGSLVVLFSLTVAIWGGGYAFQKDYSRASVLAGGEAAKLDWTSEGYVGPMFLYMFYGFYDSAWQVCVYWYMGSLTNNSRKLANFTGFYKGIQSAGNAVTNSIDSLFVPFINEYAANFALLGGSLIAAAPVVAYYVRDSVPIEDDLKFSDETIEDVKPLGADTELTSDKV